MKGAAQNLMAEAARQTTGYRFASVSYTHLTLPTTRSV